METKEFYEGPKMPEKMDKLDVKIVKDFLKNNNIDSEDIKTQKLIEGVIKNSKNTEDSLKTLYSYLSGKSSIEKRTFISPKNNSSKKDENKEEKLDQKEINDNKLDQKGINDNKKIENSKDEKKSNDKKSVEKISAKEKQKEILAYPWKNTDIVEVNGKKYKFEDVKKYLSDGKGGKLTDAFYKKLQELKKGKTSEVKIKSSEPEKIKTGNLSDKEGTIDIIEENRYY